jgi:CHAT domain-containing protein
MTTPYPDAQFKQALALKNERRYQEAAQLFIDATKTDNASNFDLANCLLEAGECYYYLVQYETAIGLFQALLGVLDQLPNELLLKADTYENLGICYGEQGERQREIDYKQRALLLRLDILSPNDESIGQSYNNLGYTFERVGNCQQALKHYKQALTIFEQQNTSATQTYIATCYTNIGNCYSNIGDYANALIYHAEALRYRRQIPHTPSTQLWIALNNIGFDYMQNGNYAASEAHFFEALDLLQTIEPSQTIRPAITLRNNLGVCYLMQKKYEQAIAQHHIALTLLQQLPDNTVLQKTTTFSNIAELFTHQQQYDTAIQYYENALQWLANEPANAAAYYATAQSGIGTCYYHLAQYGTALQHYETALQHLLPQNNENIGYGTNDNLGNNLHTDSHIKVLLATWKGKIEILYKLCEQNIATNDHESKGENIAANSSSLLQNLYAALGTCRTALQYLRHLRRSYQAESAKMQLSEKATYICEQALQIIFALYEQEPHETLLHEAFYIAEQSKSLTLLAQLRHIEAKYTANIESELLKKEQDLRNNLHVLDQYITRETEKGAKANKNWISEWKARYFDYQAQYTRLIDQLETDYPDYYRLKYDTYTASVADLQQKMRKQTMQQGILSYFVGNKKIFVFYIEANHYIAQCLPKTPAFKSLITHFLRAIKTIDKRNYCQTAYELYKTIALTLLPPAKDSAAAKSLPQLTIIPDAELLYLPFEALLSQKVDNLSTTYSQMPYLLYQYAINYHYSATLWLQTQNRAAYAKREAAGQFVGFAPIHFPTAPDDAHSFCPLTASEQMITAISQLFQQQQLDACNYIGTAATWANFKQVAADYRYLLLYTHTDINEIQPALSRILFAPQPDREDNCYLADTYTLNLNADLVLLAACETGIGELKKGEGMMGINRGFLYAGAKQVLSSLLKTPDQSTAQLLIIFFQHLIQHPQAHNYAQTLQYAKCLLLQQNQHLPPLAWAAWALIGTNDE